MLKKVKGVFSLVIFLLMNLPVGYAQKTGVSYELTIDESSPYTVLVSASFDLPQDSLFIHPALPNYDYPEGWSTFINILDDGVEYKGKSTWIMNKKKSISYTVDISYIKEDWEVGNEQAGIVINESFFLVTRALFLFPKNKESFSVSFNLPEDYTVSTPWHEVEENKFTVQSLPQLNNNTIVWGIHEHEVIQQDDFKLILVLLGVDEKAKDLAESIFTKVLRNYLEIFPETSRSNYLITAFYADQNDGEAYTNSNAFTLKNKLAVENKSVWANQFAHELFHFWNGRMINGPRRSERQWFSEGFTEYFANLSLVRTKSISESEFLRLIEKNIGLYFYFRDVQYPEVSLKEAGSRKSTYRFGVYNGGWVAAFVMDMFIRERFHQEKTLDDFMNYLFLEYGLTKQEYVYEDLVRFYKLFMNTDSSYFESYISGKENLPILKYFKRMGFEVDYTSYEGTAFIYSKSMISKEEKALRNEWIGF